MMQPRREFLKMALGVSATPVLGTPRRGQDARATPTGGRLPIRSTGSKIKSIETFTSGALSIVRVRTDSGQEGYGQIAPFNADISATVLHRMVAPKVLGKDPAALDAISDRCIEDNYKFPWSFICRALAGLDTALWDLHGKTAGKSVCELLGGRPRPLPVYGSSMSRDIKPVDEAARLARLRDEKGFRAFKIRVGKVCGHDEDQWPGRTEELVPTVRKAIGNEIALLADGNSCYTAPKAIEVGKMLGQNGVCHFEEPCPYWELEWTAQVAAALDVPVAGGEQDNDLAQWRRMIAMHAVDIVQPDICYVGGLTRALRVADMAAQAGLPSVPHSANLSLVTVFTLHLQGAIKNAGPHVEFSIEPTRWTDDLFEPALKVTDGKVPIPSGPGWGVTISKDWLAKAERQVTQKA
ncbi:MAG: mandelate racemase/muconate lactonizing enzyme family protein [Planctomycetes bacterium]|nr:mandelate racemase/muconate lactonizing enzyme family protein [Planctomycetota bacterium]